MMKRPARDEAPRARRFAPSCGCRHRCAAIVKIAKRASPEVSARLRRRRSSVCGDTEIAPPVNPRGISGASSLRLGAARVEVRGPVNTRDDVCCDGPRRVASRQSVAPLASAKRGDGNS
jgi:hypothetical protein